MISPVQKFNLDLSSVPDAALESLVLNDHVPVSARAGALDLYASRKPVCLSEMLAKLAIDKDADLVIGALRQLAAVSPEAAALGFVLLIDRWSKLVSVLTPEGLKFYRSHPFQPESSGKSAIRLFTTPV